jgi:glycosyltransferase involved in cell wall biosynthesis
MAAAAGPKRTVLLLAYYYPPQNTSSAQRPFQFARYWERFGYQARVVASPLAGGERQAGVHRTAPAATRLAPLAIRSRGWDLIQSVVSPYNERLPWFPYGVATARRVISTEPVAAMVSTGPPWVTQMVALAVHRRYPELPWVADFQDPLVGNPFRTSRRAGITYRLLEKTIVRQARAVIANTEAAATRLRERYAGQAEKITAIPNGYDPQDQLRPAPIPPRPYRELLHCGTLYGGRHPGLLLQALDRLIGRGAIDPATLKVRLVGRIEQDLTIRLEQEPFAALRRLGCLEYNNRHLPLAEARARVAQADSLLLLDLSESHDSVQAPAKVLDYISVGRPILAFTRRGSPAAEMLARSGVRNVCIDPTEAAEAVDAAVERFLRLPNEPARASPWFLRNYDAAVHAGKVAEILDRLIGGAVA